MLLASGIFNESFERDVCDFEILAAKAAYMYQQPDQLLKEKMHVIHFRARLYAKDSLALLLYACLLIKYPTCPTIISWYCRQCV
jgi:hypothetical protein